jgi:hypothetical protein
MALLHPHDHHTGLSREKQGGAFLAVKEEEEGE